VIKIRRRMMKIQVKIKAMRRRKRRITTPTTSLCMKTMLRTPAAKIQNKNS